MTRTLLLLLAALLAAPTAHAAGAQVHDVVFDRVEAVAAADFLLQPCEDTAVFVPLATGFRFEERQPGTGAVGPTPYPGGYLAVGCGEASTHRQVPAGARSVEVRFAADRGIDEFDVNGAAVTRPGRDFAQVLEFRGGNGTGDRRDAYVPAEGGPLPLQEIAPESFLLPRGSEAFDLAWVFQDNSYFVGAGLPDVLSGESYSATVQDVTLRYPGIPLPHRVGDSLEREGRLLVGETRVRVDVASPGDGDLRLVVDDGLEFAEVRGPDGRRVSAQATRTAAGPDGFDRQAVLVESLDGGLVQVTVPRELLSGLGPGKYTVSFTSVDAVETYPWLLPLAVLVLLAPLPFALLAYRHVRRFEDEAFGGFRRSAFNLRIALIVGFAYYVVVLASHFVGSRLELMTAWPVPLEASLLYLQVVIAVAAFLALFAVARELYRITVPKALPDAAPAPTLPEDPDA